MAQINIRAKKGGILMTSIVVLFIVVAVAAAAIVIVGVSVSSWAAVERARHESNGAISYEVASELRAELAEIKENLAEINKMLREVQ